MSAALWGYRMWEWLRGSGRGVWLWGPNGKHFFKISFFIISCFANHFWSVCTCFSLVVQECYKDCCKKCSLSNGAHCSDGPCCNGTCLVRHFTFASPFIMTSTNLLQCTDQLFLSIPVPPPFSVLPAGIQLSICCKWLWHIRDLFRRLGTGFALLFF